ncbi:MAG: hypothetical protein ACFFCZ_08565 [Promethearchaeota archaeon]
MIQQNKGIFLLFVGAIIGVIAAILMFQGSSIFGANTTEITIISGIVGICFVIRGVILLKSFRLW